MIDIQHSSLIWRFEAAGLEDNTIIGSSSIFSVGDVIYKNVKIIKNESRKNIFGEDSKLAWALSWNAGSWRQQKSDDVRWKNEFVNRQNENTRVTNGNVRWQPGFLLLDYDFVTLQNHFPGMPYDFSN